MAFEPTGSLAAMLGGGLGKGMGQELDTALTSSRKQGALKQLFKPEYGFLAPVISQIPEDKWQSVFGELGSHVWATPQRGGRPQAPRGMPADAGMEEAPLTQQLMGRQRSPNPMELMQSMMTGKPVDERLLAQQFSPTGERPMGGKESLFKQSVPQEAMEAPEEEQPLFSGGAQRRLQEMQLKREAQELKKTEQAAKVQERINKENAPFTKWLDEAVRNGKTMDPLLDEYEQLLQTGNISSPQQVALFQDGRLAATALTSDTHRLLSLSKEISSFLDLLRRGNPSQGRIKYAESMKFNPAMPMKAQAERIGDIRGAHQRTYDLDKATSDLMEANQDKEPAKLQRKAFEKFDEMQKGKKSLSVPSGSKAGDIVTINGKRYRVGE